MCQFMAHSRRLLHDRHNIIIICFHGKREIVPEVREDNISVTEAEWERINGKAVVDTETVDSVTDTLTDASLKLNGVSDGMISYNRVVELLLQWYGQQREY